MNGNDSRFAAAAARFEAATAAAGWTINSQYQGAQVPVDVTCAEGHQVAVRPTNFMAGKRCVFCVGHDSAEGRFIAAVAAQGGRVVGNYAGNQAPVHVICAVGHDASPRPANVLNGQGICRFCKTAAGRHDAFYIVTGQGCVKFGISVGDSYDRLGVHRRDGYDTVERLWTDIPGTTALDTEREVKRVLAFAGMAPFRGHEYFAGKALPAVVAVATRLLTGCGNLVVDRSQ